jgi:beta-galactosidase
MGVMVDMIDMACELDGYKIVIAPMLYLLKDNIVEKLHKFVENGGILVATYHSGIVDENDLCHLGAVPHGLTDVFGLRREEIDALYDRETNSMHWNGKKYILKELCERIIPSTANILSVYNEDFYAGEPVLCENDFGKGKAYYLAARAEQDFNNNFYKEIVQLARVKPSLNADLPIGVTAGLRYSDKKEFIFVQNYNSTKVEFTLKENLADLENGDKVNGAMYLEGYETRILWRESI